LIILITSIFIGRKHFGTKQRADPELNLEEITESFFTLSSRLIDLKSLRLSQSDWDIITFPGELFPSVIELHTYFFSSVQLTGMTHLRHLRIDYTPCNQIFEKEDICTQLKSFSYSWDGNSNLDDSFDWVLKNVTGCLIRRKPHLNQISSNLSVKKLLH
jgi:hypothetical protein